MDESFGALLRRFREAAALTQEALAERASVSSTAIAALERGRNRAPRLSTLRQLGRALDLSADQLAQLSTSARVGRLPPAPADSAPDVRGPMSRVGESEETATPGIDGPPGPKGLRGEVPAAAQHRWRSDFVGRSVECDRLRAAWKQRRRLIEVVGESGIGKTRLVAELARRANEDGTVLWGRCSPDGLGSYLPFVEVLRQLVAEADLATLSRAVGASGELTRLVPELTERLGALPLPARAEAGRTTSAVRRRFVGPRPVASDASRDRRPALGRLGSAGNGSIPRPRSSARRSRHRCDSPADRTQRIDDCRAGGARS
jgi:transcriptional regulator with XRE-family HTH domain